MVSAAEGSIDASKLGNARREDIAEYFKQLEFTHCTIRNPEIRDGLFRPARSGYLPKVFGNSYSIAICNSLVCVGKPKIRLCENLKFSESTAYCSLLQYLKLCFSGASPHPHRRFWKGEDPNRKMLRIIYPRGRQLLTTAAAMPF